MSNQTLKTPKGEISFTKEVKEEIALFTEENQETAAALLSAFIKINGNLVLRNQQWLLEIKTENIKAAKLIVRLLKEYYQSQTNIRISEKKRLRVSTSNKIIHIDIHSSVKPLLESLQIYDTMMGTQLLPDKDLLKTSESQRCYLAGAFLASGSVNSPLTSEYHLEISVGHKEYGLYLVRLMKRFYLNSKVIKRRNHWIVYLKRSDQIADFLKIVSAYKALMKYEDIRIQRDQFNSMNRVYNCDIANEMKAQASGSRQKRMLDYLANRIGLHQLEEPLIVAAQLRYQNPEASLNELARLYFEETGQPISKSGMNHKLRKIMEFGQKMGGELDD